MKRWCTDNGYEIIQVLGGRSGAFVVAYQNKFILVDTGTTGGYNRLLKKIDMLTNKTGEFTALILTHTHFDHSENAAKLKEKYHIPIIVNFKEADNLASGESPVPKGSTVITAFFTDLLSKNLGDGSRFSPVKPDILVYDYYPLESMGFELVYIAHTPGHTLGSQSVIVDNQVAIVGDTMFGIWRGSVFPPFVEDKSLLMHSWRKLLDTKCTIFLPAHGSLQKRELLQKTYQKKGETL